jgi:hypothetical protein
MKYQSFSDLPSRVRRVVGKTGVASAGELALLTSLKVMEIKDAGEQTMGILREFLAERGLTFADERMTTQFTDSKVEESCKTCRFWKDLREEGDPIDWEMGQCRFNPPTISEQFVGKGFVMQDFDDERFAGGDWPSMDTIIADATVFPITDQDQWCGDYQPRP